jgi:hypothetical protein
MSKDLELQEAGGRGGLSVKFSKVINTPQKTLTNFLKIILLPGKNHKRKMLWQLSENPG